MTKNALIVFPGRGSYRPEHLGGLNTKSQAVKVADSIRMELGREAISSLDAYKKFSPRKHIAGENASLLTAVYSLSDIETLSDDVNIVAMCGNSMGWYTTLTASGGLTHTDGLSLIEHMGHYQENNVIGGQLLYPLMNDDWTLNQNTFDDIQRLVDTVEDLHWSIILGHQAVLGGTAEAIKKAQNLLPAVSNGRLSFPLQLPLHSAFHTPIMSNTSLRANKDLASVSFQKPKYPLFDGRGHHWRPLTTNPLLLREYTLDYQVTKPFNFRDMIQSAVQEYAPDCIILPGPGDNLGGAIAQSLIDIRWEGMKNKSDFMQRQSDNPYLISMAREEQRKLVT